jgi:putative ABC transport system ATP-binding protein
VRTVDDGTVESVQHAVTVRGLRHAYPTPEGPLVVLDGIDVDIDGGEIVAITGPSGSGKTTLLSLLGGLEELQSGQVLVAGHDLAHLAGTALAAYRRSTVGFVFQDFGLLGQLTALENVELALTLSGVARRRRRARARALLDAVGLTPRAEHRPHALSGGENQRVAIARALANDPALVLADEPTGNLDNASTERVLDLLGALPETHGCTLLVVTHDDAVAARANRRLHLVDGRVADSVPTR